MLAPTFVVILTVIYVKYLKVETSLKEEIDKFTKKKYRINFPFDCKSCCVVYLLTYLLI